MQYIKADKALHRMRTAARKGQVIYLYASAGMGKTQAIHAFLGKKPYLTLDCKEGYLESMPDLDHVPEENVVFEHVCAVRDRKTRKYICDCIRNGKKQFFLESRGAIPDWLIRESFSADFKVLNENVLIFSDEQIRELFAEKDIELSEDDLEKIRSSCHNNSLMILYLSRYFLKDGYFADALLRAKTGLYQYLDQVYYAYMNDNVQRDIVLLSWLDQFDVPLGRFITGDNSFQDVLNHMLGTGDYIISSSDGLYTFKGFYKTFLEWKFEAENSEQVRVNAYERAAAYFELQNDFVRALDAYRRAKNYDKLSDLLCRIAAEHPGMENYQELEPFFEAVPIDVINRTPVLLSAMCMIASLKVNKPQANAWYNRMKKMLETAPKGSNLEKELQIRMLFLAIVSPIRDHSAIVEDLFKVPDIARRWNGHMGKASVIDYTPSVLSGGIDLCDAVWGNRADEAQRKVERLQNAIRTILGPEMEDFAKLVFLEDAFEQSIISENKLNVELNEVYIHAMTTENIEFAYVAIWLLIKSYIAHGAMSTAETTLSVFLEKVEKSGDKRMAFSVRSCYVWMKLYSGDLSEGRRWIKQAPNSNAEFSFLDRYLYLVKTRVYLAMGRIHDAYTLINRLEALFAENYRPFFFF